jgi:predicted TIM-barrel fold metal-dependent hydrolase
VSAAASIPSNQHRGPHDRLPPVVDAHTHTFPAAIVHDRAPFLARDDWFGQLFADPRAALVDASGMLAAMAGAGVGQAVVCGFPWRDPGLCRLHNDDLAETAAASGGRLPWLATVSPRHGTAAAREAARCFDLGAVGLGELNADAQGFDLADPHALAPIVDVCLAHDRPILLHASEPVGHPYPGKGTATPARLLELLVAFPALRLVLAHWGGGLPFYELMPEVATATAHVVYDTAASTYLYRPAVFRAVLDLVGPERVLFASDHPVLRMDRFLRRVLADGSLRPNELAPVLGGNARRFYHLPEPAAPAHRSEGGEA